MTKLEKLKKQLADIEEQIKTLEAKEQKAKLAKAEPLGIEMAEVTTKLVMREIPRYCPGCFVDLTEMPTANCSRGIKVVGYSPSTENWSDVDASSWKLEESLDAGDLMYVTEVYCNQCSKLLIEVKEK